MKNKLIRYLIVVFCIMAILFALVKVLTPSKKVNTYLAIGDYLSVSGDLKGESITSFTNLLGDYLVDNKLVENVNYSYSSSGIDSSKLLEMINKDAYLSNGDNLIKQIENSKYITISVGMNDILQYIRFDSNNKEIIYDKEFIKRKLEVMKQNYYESVEEIKNINDEVSVYLIGYYCPFATEEDDFSEVFNMLNDSIRQVSELMSVNYVDISSVNKKENMVYENEIYLNSLGHELVFASIREYLHQ